MFVFSLLAEDIKNKDVCHFSIILFQKIKKILFLRHVEFKVKYITVA